MPTLSAVNPLRLDAAEASLLLRAKALPGVLIIDMESYSLMKPTTPSG
jgi:hypothetical protein